MSGTATKRGYIKLGTGKAYFGMNIGDEAVINGNTTEVVGFRMVLTAGFCIPTVQGIFWGTDKPFYDKIGNPANKGLIQISIGSSANEMHTMTVDIVGHHVKEMADGKFVCSWGGVLMKNKLCAQSFLEVKKDDYVKDSALNTVRKTWTEETGCGIKDEIGAEKLTIIHPYKRHKKTLNNHLVDVFLHIDTRPSFPLATIDRDCDLVLKDFQTVRDKKAKALLCPSSNMISRIGFNQPDIVIPYLGKAESVSYKPYAMRACGYTQINANDAKKGKVNVAIDSLEETWQKNKLASTQDNGSNNVDTMSRDVYKSSLTTETPMAYHTVALHNKNHSINMSSISTKVMVEGKYLPNIDVLDLVKLTTGKAEDPISGLYLIEAMEIGIVQGSEFTTVMWLCRDNDNDKESSIIDPYRHSVLKALRISDKDKETIIKGIRRSRSGLARARSIMDGSLRNEWERYLIALKKQTLSSFDLTGATLNLNDKQSMVNSLKNAGTNVANMFITKMIKSPYDMFFRNMLSKSPSLYDAFIAVLSAVLGGKLFPEVSSLLSDLKSFDLFLTNYKNTVSTVAYKNSPNYIADVVTGTLPSIESAYGVDFNPNDPDVDGFGLRTMNMADLATATEEATKVATLEEIISDITKNIPDSVDIPIPEIKLDDTDIYKPKEELKDEIIQAVVDDLIDRGYVYDSTKVDVAGATGSITKADGTKISYSDAKKTMAPSSVMTEILQGKRDFDATIANRIQFAVGTEIKVRHWGTFFNLDDLMSYNVAKSYVDKYKTVNTTKFLSVTEGKKVFVALPASEVGTIFYINSDRVLMNEMDCADLGYYDKKGRPIPYVIYYTSEGYNSSNLQLELRKGV